MFGNCQEQSFLGWSIPIAVAGVGPRSNGITKFAERRKRVITLARSSVIRRRARLISVRAQRSWLGAHHAVRLKPPSTRNGPA